MNKHLDVFYSKCFSVVELTGYMVFPHRWKSWIERSQIWLDLKSTFLLFLVLLTTT